MNTMISRIIARILMLVTTIALVTCAHRQIAEQPRPASCHSAVRAFFNSTDPFVQETVLPNIEKHRKSDATLRIVSPNGQALANLKVTAALRRHEFLFGICPPQRNLITNPAVVRAWSSLVNYAVTQNLGKWASVERQQGAFDYSHVDNVVELCRRHDVALEYHFLTGYHPTWLTNLPFETWAQLQQKFARDIVRRYRDRVAFFQVYNEDWLTQIPLAKVFFDQTAFFAALTKEFPGLKFGVSDCWRLDRSRDWPTPAEFQQRYPGIAFVAVHAHQPRGLWANPRDLYHQFDRFLDSEVKLHITEFGINLGPIEGGYRQGEWTEAAKAEYFVQMWATAFSHPAVDAFNHWDMGPEKLFLSGNALLNPDGTPLPAYDALYSLVRDKLHTRADSTTSAAGQFGFRGFHGQYALTVETPNGARLETRFTLAATSPETTIVCDFKAGTLHIADAKEPTR